MDNFTKGTTESGLKQNFLMMPLWSETGNQYCDHATTFKAGHHRIKARINIKPNLWP